LCVADLPDDAAVTIRVFRFLEDQDDAGCAWERELRNVNSGSLLWLVVHMQPKMHSVAGRKYGQWFTVHHIRVLARHFRSGYHMAQEGSCPFAKTFGATVACRTLVTSESLPTGYFWFVSPDRAGFGPSAADVGDEENLHRHGWQHLGRAGPFDGEALLAAWQRRGAAMEEAAVQDIVRVIMENRE